MSSLHLSLQDFHIPIHFSFGFRNLCLQHIQRFRRPDPTHVPLALFMVTIPQRQAKLHELCLELVTRKYHAVFYPQLLHFKEIDTERLIEDIPP